MLLMASKYTNFAITQEQSTILQICQISNQENTFYMYSRINIYFHLISTGGTDIAGTDR